MKLCESELAPLKQSKYDSSYIHLAAERVIFLKEPVTKELASELAALLLYYDNEDQKEDITLYIHSNGGDADGLINIYDVMHMIKAPIQTICLGKAYSAAAVMLAAGSKGKRYAFKNSKIMIHGVQFSFPIPGEETRRIFMWCSIACGRSVIMSLIRIVNPPLDFIRVCYLLL
jgi:ATP-dependent Clp protease protease subunit